MEDLTGVVLNHRYKIERFVGSGGMAEVYKARDVDAPHYYAIKVIREQLLEHPSLVQRFREEAQRLKELQHPNIVRFYDFVVSDGLTYIVMDYIDGYPLSRLLRLRRQRGEGPLPIEESVRILAQIARALARVHEQGLVHRDVKPGNILIRQTDGAAFLTDLGIAKDLTTGAVTQTLVGTFAYLAPEQILRQPVSAATDIYALGTVAYQLFTGRRPFETGTEEPDSGELEQALIEQHLRHLPRPPSTLNPRLPSELDAVLSRALAKPPEARYGDAMSFMRAVHDAARPHLPADMQILSQIDARPVPTRLAPRPPATRRGFRRAALAVLGLALAAIAAVLLLTGGVPGLNLLSLSTDAPASPTSAPNLTATAEWLTLEAERLMLEATGTALGLLLTSPPGAATAAATPSLTATASDTPTPSATATPSAPPSPTPTQTRTSTPTATPTATSTDTPTLDERATARAGQRVVQATGTMLALTVEASPPTESTPSRTPTATRAAAAAPTSAPPALSPPPSKMPTRTPTASPTATRTPMATPNRSATEARATLAALDATSTALARVLQPATDTPTPTPTSAAVAALQAARDWCRQASLLQDATGFGEEGAPENQVNEEALLQYLVERDAAPVNPNTGEPPGCMARIDAWLYPRLLDAARIDFEAGYGQPLDLAIVRVDRARRYLDYAEALQPSDEAVETLRACVNVLSLLHDPAAAREAIAALRAREIDLSACEPTLSRMWETAITPTPTARTRATVIQSSRLYDLPARNPIGILGWDVPVVILAQTDAIDGVYWFLVELDDGRRGYLPRQALDWEGGLENVPLVALTPSVIQPTPADTVASTSPTLAAPGQTLDAACRPGALQLNVYLDAGRCTGGGWAYYVLMAAQGGACLYDYYWDGRPVARGVNGAFTMSVEMVGDAAITGAARVESNGEAAEQAVTLPPVAGCE